MQSEEKGLRYSYRFRIEAEPDGSESEDQSKSDIQAYINELLEINKKNNPKDDLLTI